MFTVQLETIKLYAPVGLYPQEAVLENELEINIAVRDTNATIETLPFIDYSKIYTLVRRVCTQRTELLEQLLQELFQQLRALYPHCLFNISIAKCNPPVGGKVAQSKISWTEF